MPHRAACRYGRTIPEVEESHLVYVGRGQASTAKTLSDLRLGAYVSDDYSAKFWVWERSVDVAMTIALISSSPPPGLRSPPMDEGSSECLRAPGPGLGDRVILRTAQGRFPGALGTVIDLDPYEDRGAVLEVLHEDGNRRWRRRKDLRRLGLTTSRETLASDLIGLLGDEAPAWTGAPPSSRNELTGEDPR